MTTLDALTKCHRCGAHYDGGVRWYAGHYDTSAGATAPERFVAHSKIKMGHCPFCRKPPQLEAAPQRVAM